MNKFITTLLGRAAAILAFFALVLGSLTLAAPAANAATSSDGDKITYELNLNISDAASSDSSFDYRSRSIVRSATNADGLPVFYPVNKPSAHWRMANAKKCPTLKAYPSKKMVKRLYANPTTFKFKKGSKAEVMFRKAAMSDRFVKRGPTDVMSASCFWLRPGAKFPDTVKDITNQVRGVGNSVKGNKPMLFEVAKASSRRSGESTDALVPVRRGQDFDGDGVIDDGDCGNKKPAVIEYNEGEYEYSDSDSYWWKDEGDVEARVHVGGSATIRQGNCVMTLNYDFFAQGKADYSVLVKGKTSIEAHGNAVEIISKQSAHVDASANATASVKANLEAEFTGCNTPPQQVHQNPVGELYFGEHAVDLYGTMPVFGRVRATDGATPVMGTPQVAPSDLGTVSNWRPVPTNKDGAACEAGWVCYQGTFRVTKNGTPGTYVYGTMVSHMSDSMGGNSNTDSKSFSVYYKPYVETRVAK